MILDVAYAVFLEHGFDRASMSAIAERADVTKPVIYDSFASKEELFAALRAQERARILAEVVAALPENAEVDLEASLIAGLTAFLTYVKKDPEAFRMIVLGEGASGEAAIRIQQHRAEYIETVAAMLEDWGRAGTRPRPGVELIAHSVVGAAEGMARAIMNEPDRYEPEVAAQLLSRVLARGASAL